MSYNNYMYAIDRSDEYLEHYGIKGMKWGVRKAIESGDSRKLARAYKKASRKLAKLEKRATNGKKYARRAALLGAGAAAAGGLAAAGTQGVGDLVRGTGRAVSAGSVKGGVAITKLGKAMTKAGIRGGGRVSQIGSAMTTHGLQAGSAISGAGRAVQGWGGQTALKLDNAASRRLANHAAAWREQGVKNLGAGNGALAARQFQKASQRKAGAEAAKTAVSNNTLARIGAGAVGAGLAAGAGYNAYRAATTKRAARKAAEFRSEMNKAFKGTQYDTSRSSNNKRKRRR